MLSNYFSLQETLRAKWIISCCGLYSDRVAMMSGSPAEPKVVPIRGEYLVLDSSKCHLVKGNIYPVSTTFSYLSSHIVRYVRFPILNSRSLGSISHHVWMAPCGWVPMLCWHSPERATHTLTSPGLTSRKCSASGDITL